MSAKPERFDELCGSVGLALMLGQKVQFALAHYFAVYHSVHEKWNKAKMEEIVDFHLSKPMGVVVAAIKKQAPLEDDLAEKIRAFKELRNWLAHDFDQEATPFLTKGQKVPEYIERMNEVCAKATEVMVMLGEVGEKLIPVRANYSLKRTAADGLR
jgi:hypothetical protein